MNFRSAIITVCAVALAGNSAGCKKSSKTVSKVHSTGTTDDKTVQTEGIHMVSGPETLKQVAPSGEEKNVQTERNQMISGPETVKQIAPIGEKPADQTQA